MSMNVRKSRLAVVGAAGVVATLGVFAMGCNTAHLKELKSAASDDLQCPKSRVHILTENGKTRDVEACGQLATYHWEDGDWRMIARGGQGAQPAKKAAPGGPPPVAPPQAAPVLGTPTGTPSQPPPSSLPPSQPPAAGGKQI
jgi:hypothetical protein